MQILHDGQIDKAAFKQLLLRQRISRERFKSPLTPRQTTDALTAAFEAEIEYRRNTPQLTPEAVARVEEAALWLCGDGSAGLMLLGTVGSGKTTLMRAVAALVNCFKPKDFYGQPTALTLVTATDLARIARDDYKKFRELCQRPMLGLDDLGQEPAEILDYGNSATPAIELLSRRYDDQLFTLCTSNLGKSGEHSVRSRYGDRTADRLNEMMHTISFGGKSYRKSQ